jgi:3-dehydroquinate dehydratase/shikimate dehydrogenase
MSRPLLCVTVTAATTADLRRRRDEAAAAGADLVELRLDSVSDPNVAGALAGRRGPVVVTCRPTWEGGGYDGPEDSRRQLLADALALGAEYVDVEWRARFDDLLAHAGGRRIVVSYHDFDGLPADLADVVRAMASTGAEIVKLAVKARRLSDCVTLRDVATRSDRRAGLILIGMGDFGLATRVLPERFGSAWTYAGNQRQVGQLAASTLLKEYRFRSLHASTDLYGLVGLPVSHSVSPAMHNAAFAAAGIDAVYLPLPAVSADDFVTFGRAFGVKGVSITTPHKISLMDRVDEVHAVAKEVGAINTIRVEDGRAIGRNTDVEGFLKPLAGRMSLSGLRTSVLGGGGAARAVALALSSSGCRVTVHARRREQVDDIAARTGAQAGPFPPARGSWDVLVNATSVGMYPNVDETPIDASHLDGSTVYDLVYNPPATRLLREAAAVGCSTIGGLEMLVGQAEAQFEWWTGVRPAPGVMSEAALLRLAEFRHDEHHVV